MFLVHWKRTSAPVVLQPPGPAVPSSYESFYRLATEDYPGASGGRRSLSSAAKDYPVSVGTGGFFREPAKTLGR